MNKISFFATLILHLIIVVFLNLLDDFILTLLFLFSSLLIGLFLQLKHKLKNIAKGVIYASLTSFLLLIVYVFYVLMNLS